MGTKGKRLYKCDDCGTTRYVHWTERNHAAKPRCYRCGSTRLEAASENAKIDEINGNRSRVAGAGGGVVLASNLDPKHRKVT